MAAKTIILRKPVARESTVAAEIESIDRRMDDIRTMVLEGAGKVSVHLPGAGLFYILWAKSPVNCILRCIRVSYRTFGV